MTQIRAERRYMNEKGQENIASPVPARVWAVALLLCAVAWSFRTTSFMHAKELVLVGALVIATPLQWHLRCLYTPKQRLLLPLWAGLLFWAVTGVFQAKVHGYLLESLVRWQLYLTVVWLAVPAFSVPGGKELLYKSLIGSAWIVAVLALLQYAGALPFLFPIFPAYTQPAYSVFGNQNLLGGYVALALVLLPLLALYFPGHTLSSFVYRATAWLTLLAAVLISGSRSAWLAVFFGLAVFFMSFFRKMQRQGIPFCSKARRAGGVSVLVLSLVLILLGMPLLKERIEITFTGNDVGGPARLWFWAGAREMIRERPFLGVGLGNYTYWSPFYQGKVLWNPGGEGFFRNTLHTDHAHSEPIEWLAETGVAGCLFWILFLCLVAARSNPAAPALLALAFFALLNNFSHSPPHLLAFLLLALNPEEECTKDELPRKLWIFPAAALIIVCYLGIIAVPSVLQCAAEDQMDAGVAPEKAFAAANAWPWQSPSLQESLAAALIQEEKYQEAKQCLEQAIKGLDSYAVHRLLLYCARTEDATAVYRAARNCLYRCPDDSEVWELLMKNCPPEELAFWQSRYIHFLPPVNNQEGDDAE